LIRQTQVESVLLALLGGAVGLFVAYAGTSAILFIAFRGANFVPIHAEPSAAVLGFAMLVSVLTGIVFGAAPAWISARFEPADVLRGASRSTGNRSTLPQRSLVIFQAALSLVLLAYAGLLTSSLRNLEHQQFGFETGGRVMVEVNPAFTGYSPDRLRAAYERLERRLTGVSGVVSASLALYSPMEGENWSSEIQVAGRPAGSDTGSSWDRVSAHYFETIGTRLVSGRPIDERDSPGAPFVTVVNQTFAKKFFPNQDPLGKRFGFATPQDYQIVGVVEDAKYLDARDSAWPTFFLPLLQMNAKDWEESGMARSNYIGAIQLRVARAPSELEPGIRQAIAETDSNLTVLKVRTFADQLATNFNQERLLARLTALFGILALIVASVGLYGITSYAVVRRTSEIGIRIALGASRTDVVRMVLKNSMLQTTIGLAIGVVASLAGAKVLANILYGVTGTDPIILAGATVILGGCGAIAGLIPALRAAGIDPIRALRTE